MNGVLKKVLFIGLALAIRASVGSAQVCPCDGDVNNDGDVNVIDGVCITECRAGDCSCCVSSCDVNCDGVVDAGDAGDDILKDDSAWLCLFNGGAAKKCCPGPTGACCDLSIGACKDGVLEADCVGPSLVWSQGILCSEVSCPSPPSGACCDLGTGKCQDKVLAQDCVGGDLVWSEGLGCDQVSCPAPPAGACCNLGNGQCIDGLSEKYCSGTEFLWTAGALCAQIECSVPPQDPCPCDGDVNDDGDVNVIDGVCITECRAGDCSCCVSSCDVNCDGVVDAADAGDDILKDDSAWLCLFNGGAAKKCCPGPTGACCDLSIGACKDGVLEADCVGPSLVWSQGMLCSEVSCPSPPGGACCDLGTGKCHDDVLAQDCVGGDLVWSEGQGCDQVSCPAPPVGACCNLGNGQCLDAAVEATCSGADFVWTEGALCAQVECAVPPQDPCPCDGDVNDDGDVDIIDAVCISQCKAGDCSCCVSSCDVNCDGVVNATDAGDDILHDRSTWLCLFKGGSQDLCCSAQYQALLHRSAIPTINEWGVVILALLLLTAGSFTIRCQRRRITGAS